MFVYNTEQRKQDLILKLSEVFEQGVLSKHDALVLRGRLGFADSFLHGRLGKLVLKQVVEHAYSRSKEIGSDLQRALLAMKTRLECGKPLQISERNGLCIQMHPSRRRRK